MARARFPDQRDVLAPRARLTPALSALLLAALALLIVWGLFAGFLHHGPNWRAAGGADAEFYSALIRDVRGGASYYAVAPEELRRWGFPLRPVFTMRPPLLTLALAELPDAGSRYIALAALGAGAWLAWAWRLWPAYRHEPLRCAWALALLSSGLEPDPGPGRLSVPRSVGRRADRPVHRHPGTAALDRQRGAGAARRPDPRAVVPVPGRDGAVRLAGRKARRGRRLDRGARSGRDGPGSTCRRRHRRHARRPTPPLRGGWLSAAIPLSCTLRN